MISVDFRKVSVCENKDFFFCLVGCGEREEYQREEENGFAKHTKYYHTFI